MNGQKIRRPTSNNAAGKKVKDAMSEQTMPMAPVGPSAALLFNCDSIKHNKPTATVPALAAMGSQDARSAMRIASYFESFRRSSSRYLDMSSSE